LQKAKGKRQKWPVSHLGAVCPEEGRIHPHEKRRDLFATHPLLPNSNDRRSSLLPFALLFFSAALHSAGGVKTGNRPLLPFALLFRRLTGLPLSEGRPQGPPLRASFLPFAFCLLPFALLSFTTLSFAQSPYAAIDRNAVSYNGPGRDKGHDLGGTETRLGLLAPLSGPRQAEGEALRRGAELAIEEENAAALPAGRRLALAIADESGPWGRASSQAASLLFEEHALAIVTSADGGSAHLAEQLANKFSVPILTLSSDATTTEINLPWIFRLGPTDAVEARAFAQDIYHRRKLERVALLVQEDHDGRLGGEEFVRAAHGLNAPAPIRITVGPALGDGKTLVPLLDKDGEGVVMATLRAVEAVVIWSDAAAAGLILPRLERDLPSAPIYLCRKAAQTQPLLFPHSLSAGLSLVGRGAEPGGVWMAAADSAFVGVFAKRYHERFGEDPGMGAAQAYDAVRILAASLRLSGPNRARLRDALAEVSGFPCASGTVSFDHAGNNISLAGAARW
jgi:branched-chain amino acid transport system substrate-binding protein